MAKKKKKVCPPLALWLVTFSDLVTLLLTFFVLLLTMSSMDQSFLTRVTVTPKDLGALDIKGSGKVSIEAELVLELIERPWEVLEKQERIKDLLFPEQSLPPDINRSTLDKNLKIIAKDDGVALVITDRLLFPRGGAVLDDASRDLLLNIAQLLWTVNERITIAGYADDQEPDPYAVSADRALAVLSYFVELGLPDDQFSLSAYGADQPLSDSDTPAGRSRNRRVEILIHNNAPLGGYPS